MFFFRCGCFAVIFAVIEAMLLWVIGMLSGVRCEVRAVFPVMSLAVFFFRTVSAPDFGIRAGCFSGTAALRGGSDGSFSLLCFNFSCDVVYYWVFLGFITCLISLRLGRGLDAAGILC